MEPMDRCRSTSRNHLSPAPTDVTRGLDRSFKRTALLELELTSSTTGACQILLDPYFVAISKASMMATITSSAPNWFSRNFWMRPNTGAPLGEVVRYTNNGLVLILPLLNLKLGTSKDPIFSSCQISYTCIKKNFLRFLFLPFSLFVCKISCCRLPLTHWWETVEFILPFATAFSASCKESMAL